MTDANAFNLENPTNPTPIFTHLVLGGGGMMGAVYIGAFRYLYERPELLIHIKTVIGTSVGAVFACAFALNMSIHEIELFWKHMLDAKNKRYDIDIVNLLNILDTNGLDTNTRPLEMILKYIKDLTFRDFVKKTGKDLIFCATNALNMKPVYFSVNTTPNVLVSDALYASCALPLLFTPVVIGDSYYIDGGITDNIPVSYISKKVPCDTILVLALESNNPDVIRRYSLPIIVLNSMLTLVQNSALYNIYGKRYKYFVSFKDIPIKPVEFTVNDDKIYICTTIEKLDKCFEIGYKTMYTRMNNLDA